MPPERVANFRKSVAAHLRAAAAKGKSETDVVGQMVVEQVALAKALSDSGFIKAMALDYAHARAELRGSATLHAARSTVVSILNNRIADCKGFVLLLAQPEFIAAARAEAAQPAPAAVPYALSAAKLEEIIDDMTYSKGSAALQPAAHVAMSLDGHQIGHQALAAIFEPKAGALRAPLVHALATAWPQATAGEIEHIAEGWLKARYEPALAVAEGSKPGGAIYEESMRRANAAQAEKLKLVVAAEATADAAIVKAKVTAKVTEMVAGAVANAMAGAAIAKAKAGDVPRPETTAPRINAGTVHAAAELMMDTL